jgi:hypothetical protein
MKKITLFAALMLMSLLGNAQVDLNNGLLAYYPYNGNANDAVGTANGTVNGATLTTDRFGTADRAYSFSSQTITSEISYNLDDNFSVNFWYVTSSTENDIPLFWSSVDRLNYSELVYKINGSNYKVRAEFVDDNSSAMCSHADIIGNNSSGTNYSDGQWHMVSIINNNSTFYLYVDTILIDSTVLTDPCQFTSSVGEFFVGNSTSIYGYTGKVDDIMVYSRAINAQERAHLYNLTSTYSVTPTSTISLENSTINIFPNPVSNIANIQFETNGTYQVEVIDITGRIIYSNQTNEQNLQINTSAWAAGIYAVTISNENGLLERKKIVKQ